MRVRVEHVRVPAALCGPFHPLSTRLQRGSVGNWGRKPLRYVCLYFLRWMCVLLRDCAAPAVDCTSSPTTSFAATCEAEALQRRVKPKRESVREAVQYVASGRA